MHMSRNIDSGEKSEESGANVESFSCENCGQTFNSRQDLKQHSSSAH
jgi:hypothetical protein